jgi:hypothetical protein
MDPTISFSIWASSPLGYSHKTSTCQRSECITIVQLCEQQACPATCTIATAGTVPKMRLVLQACHVRLIQAPTTAFGPPDASEEEDFLNFWSDHSGCPMQARNLLISSVCSQLCNLFDAKLALLLVLLGGVATELDQLRTRGDSHLLLVGDPGTGKSQLMKHTAKLAARCVLCFSALHQVCIWYQTPLHVFFSFLFATSAFALPLVI